MHAVFISNGLYTEVFLIHEKKHPFQNFWLLLGGGFYSEGCYLEGVQYQEPQINQTKCS